MHLPKFLLPGCQRGFGFFLLLLAVVEDGRHVLPELMRLDVVKMVAMVMVVRVVVKMVVVMVVQKAIMQMMTTTLSKPLPSLDRGSAKRTQVGCQRWSHLSRIQPVGPIAL